MASMSGIPRGADLRHTDSNAPAGHAALIYGSDDPMIAAAPLPVLMVGRPGVPPASGRPDAGARPHGHIADDHEVP